MQKIHIKWQDAKVHEETGDTRAENAISGDKKYQERRDQNDRDNANFQIKPDIAMCKSEIIRNNCNSLSKLAHNRERSQKTHSTSRNIRAGPCEHKFFRK